MPMRLPTLNQFPTAWLLPLTLIAVLYSLPRANAQTCSCAGTPLLSSQDMASSRAGQFHLGLTYEYHDVSELYLGSEELNNSTFQRSTQSIILELNYGVTERLLITGLASLVKKRRSSGRNFQNVDHTQGVGDGMFMVKYTLHQNTFSEQYQLTVGGGTKIPFGATDKAGQFSPYSPDMQPGTGSWDAIGWLHFSKTFLPTSTLNLFSTISYRHTGSHDFARKSDYKFGNNFMAKIGVGNQFSTNFKYTLVGKYRHVSPFEFNGDIQPNTGGDWINLRPGINYILNNNITFRLAGAIPLYRNVNGVQSTTRYSTQVSVLYTF